MKTCHEWTLIKYIEATCPHCHVIDTYFSVDYVGDIVGCTHCGAQFVLGEQE